MTDMEKIATDCRAAASYYTDSPGHVMAETIVDLYRTIERLALRLDRRLNKEPSQQSKGIPR